MVKQEDKKLSVEAVQRIAKLARIELSEEEKEKYAKELSAVLGYIEQLSEVDTESIPVTDQVTGLVNIVRDDVVEACDEKTRNKILDAFPVREGDYIKVKAVL